MNTLDGLILSSVLLALPPGPPRPKPCSPHSADGLEQLGFLRHRCHRGGSKSQCRLHGQAHGEIRRQYMVVDIQWSEPNPKTHGYRPEAELKMDGYGRLIPAVNRFPSAAKGRGFKPLADYVHSKGLKFGMHIMRGIPRRAVDADTPVFGAKVKASAIADKASICRWNSDMLWHRCHQGRRPSLLRLAGGSSVSFRQGCVTEPTPDC